VIGSIPLAEAPSFRDSARRTTVVRLTLAVALLATAATAIATSRRLDVSATPLFGSGTSGILVLDLSSSIDAVPPREIGAVLRRLADSRAHVGLVLFSDVAYEALPSAASSSELRSYLRFFRRPPGADQPLAVQPPRSQNRRVRVITPWTRSFRGGTRISSGLELARRMIARHPGRSNDVVLVSDLNDSLFDVAPLATALAEFRRERIHLRVVPLNATPVNRAFFTQRLGDAAVVTSAELFVPQPRATNSDLPRALIGLTLVFALLLAANELRCSRLEWRPA
jgi:hypothetical protein